MQIEMSAMKMCSNFRLLARVPSRRISLSALKLTEEKGKALPAENILEPFETQTEEDIMKIRFKARLPERIYKMLVTKEPVPLSTKVAFQRPKLRSYYGMFGKDSKLNPGLCWPDKKEMLDIIEDDKVFEPPLQDRINNLESAKLAEKTRKQEVEAEVERNMANSDKWIKEFYDKIEKKKAKAHELKLEREKLVEEISEYLGYDIDPKDPRFKDAVEQRNKDKKKAQKIKRQQESYDKMLEKLREIAESK